MAKSVANANICAGPIRRAAFYPFVVGLFFAGWMAAPKATGQPTPANQGQRTDGRGNRPRTMEPRRSPDDAPNNAASSGIVDPGNGILYYGGPVLLGTTNIYYIWYGNWDSSSKGILTDFANSIGGSPYFNINTGYYDSMGRSVSNSVSLAASITDSGSRGASLTNNDIWLIVSNALSAGSLPIDSNGAYFVLTGSSVKVSGFPGSICGWHTVASYNNTNIHYAFVGNPLDNPACAHQAVSPNGNPGADAMASTIAHEMDEIVTDPDLNAWLDSSGNEVADKCAWTFGATYTLANGSQANMQLGGRNYLIQRDWVNAGGGYCALSASSGPDFALSPTVDSQSVTPGGTTGSYMFTIIPLEGFSGTVSFSVSGLPSGATASAIPSSATAAVFTVTASANLAAGAYSFTIKGTNGSLSHSAPATLVVNGQTLSPVVVSVGTISPEPSQVGQPYSVSYSVTSVAGTPAGNVTVSDGSGVCAATVAAGSCNLISTTAGAKVITVAYGGNSQFAPQSGTKAHSVAYGGSLAHLASGDGWETTFTLVNLGTGSSSMSLNFFADSGNPLNLPFTLPQNSAASLNTSGVDQTIGSNSVLLLNTGGPQGQTFSEGWANLSSAGVVSGYEVFRYDPSGEETIVPLENRNASSYVLAFDNTSLVNALGTGIAIANLASQAASVSVIIRDEAGKQIPITTGSTISMAALAHYAFVLAGQYPVTAGRRGTIEFVTPAGGRISVLGIRANGNSFTTIPVFAGGSGGGATGGAMAHIVSGGGWRSIFTVVNTGAAPANITLSFFDDGGNPLSLPLTFLQTGGALTAAKITQTLAAGASLVVQAQGLDAQVSLGSAQLTATGSASGFALFRYDPSGQEATAPLETRNAMAYVLAFDNTGPLATGVALANLSNQPTNVGMILRDDTGTPLQYATIPLPANGHFAFVLEGNYPASVGKRGTVEFDSSGGAHISVLGIRANGNAFTAIPVLTR